MVCTAGGALPEFVLGPSKSEAEEASCESFARIACELLAVFACSTMTKRSLNPGSEVAGIESSEICRQENPSTQIRMTLADANESHGHTSLPHSSTSK